MCVDVFECPKFGLNNAACSSHDVGYGEKNVGFFQTFGHLRDTALKTMFSQDLKK